MSVHFQINIDGETTEDAIAEFKRVFDGLCSGQTGELTAGSVVADKLTVSEKPAQTSDAPLDGEVIEPPKTRKSRAKKDDAKPEPEQIDIEEKIAESQAEVPTVDDVRAALLKFSKADGFGHDAVFNLLSKYDAKSASTVPEGKRAEVIAEIEKQLAGA